jgi:predicted ATPase/DNA-binding winged helix-turn-helix (wHTH) protein
MPETADLNPADDTADSSPADDLSNSRTIFMFGPFRLFVAERLLKRGDDSLPIGGRALEILITLLARAGEVISRKELIDRVWPDVTVEEANLRVHIAALRKTLGDGHDGARYVSNVAGRGYCFVAAVARSASERSLPQAEPPEITKHIHKLPARLARMVGREETVRTLLAQLITWRFVSLVGPGGVGKTTVAVSVAHALIEGFRGAVFFVDLGALADPRLVATAVASAIGFMMPAQDPTLSLVAFLRQKRVLLVLDNCEHVIEATAQLAERVVNEAPQTHILATSREALRAEGEHVHLLYSLECPPDNSGLTASEALRYPAAQLFMERALASGYHSELSDADAPMVAGICRKLDGIALAIELAASRVGSLGIGGTAELLDNRFRAVWQGRRTALPRHQTLNSMLDWSYNLLSDIEKQVFCRLSVFVGDFTIEGACEVAANGEVDDARVTHAITGLLAKSLISTTHFHRSTCYRLFDTTRVYALSKLANRGETDRVARRHATWFCKSLEQDQLLQSGGGDDLAGYAPHIGNVRAALDWALSDLGDRTIGVELTTSAVPLLIGLSLFDECRRYCERALAVIDEASRDTRAEMILQKTLAVSSMFTMGNSDEVRAAIESGLALAEKLNDRPHQLELLAGLNIFLTRIGDFNGALAIAERATAVAQAARNAADLVVAEWMLGVSHHLVGNQLAAQRHCEDGMVHAAELGAFNPNFFGYDHRVRALVALARTLWLRGLSNQALRTAHHAISEAVGRDQPVSICISLIYSESVYLWTGDWDRAAHCVDRLVEHAERHSLAPYQAVGIGLKGELAVARGESETGIPLLREALEILHSEQHNILLTVFAAALTEGLRKTGQFEEALLTINVAIGRAISSGATFHMAELLRLKAEVLADMPGIDRSAAVDCLNESLKFAREQSALAYELRSATTLSRLLSESGQREGARNTLEPVLGRFTEGFETSDLKLARALLENLR